MPLELKHGSFISLLNVIKPTTLPHIITAAFVELSSAITPAYMIPGDPKQLEILTVLSSWVESPLILHRRRLFVRSEDKGSSLQAMHKYGKVKSFRLVKHIGKGFAIALLYDLTSVGFEGASRGYAFVEYEPEKEMCRAYEVLGDAYSFFCSLKLFEMYIFCINSGV
ncbi:hypothetical protein HID58_035700 [Brassica napus]|uniref:RRM domain-containing protein n=1 Tax=Brassica napus TaxID=3708 RepID=A0ABQ8C5N0_BRANA|nr:hypothetical protein HID58_035700 [Brassica napus]